MVLRGKLGVLMNIGRSREDGASTQAQRQISRNKRSYTHVHEVSLPDQNRPLKVSVMVFLCYRISSALPRSLKTNVELPLQRPDCLRRCVYSGRISPMPLFPVSEFLFTGFHAAKDSAVCLTGSIGAQSSSEGSSEGLETPDSQEQTGSNQLSGIADNEEASAQNQAEPEAGNAVDDESSDDDTIVPPRSQIHHEVPPHPIAGPSCAGPEHADHGEVMSYATDVSTICNRRGEDRSGLPRGTIINRRRLERQRRARLEAELVDVSEQHYTDADSDRSIMIDERCDQIPEREEFPVRSRSASIDFPGNNTELDLVDRCEAHEKGNNAFEEEEAAFERAGAEGIL